MSKLNIPRIEKKRLSQETKEKRKIKLKKSLDSNKIGTTKVSSNGEITLIADESMVEKYLMFDENDVNFSWPLKGQKFTKPASSLVQKYRIFEENNPNFRWPMKMEIKK